jgi:hypothetical protein
MNDQQQTGHQALTGAFSSASARDAMRQVQDEANERGVSISVVARERFEAEQERIGADQERVQALINDPATLRRLRAQWAGETVPETAPPEPRDPNAPPSAGRNISPATTLRR